MYEPREAVMEMEMASLIVNNAPTVDATAPIATDEYCYQNSDSTS